MFEEVASSDESMERRQLEISINIFVQSEKIESTNVAISSDSSKIV
jgi:hypothetical protein